MIKIAAFILTSIAKLLSFTYRYEFHNEENLLQFRRQGRGALLALWHQNLFHGILSHANRGYVTLASSSKDGDIVTYTLHNLGYKVARGSSRRGGAPALKELVREAKNGETVAITVDGPTGPCYDVKLGIIQLSRLANAPIVPLAITPMSYWSFEKAWDKFRIPKPFSKIYLDFGDPLEIPSGNLEDVQKIYQDKIKEKLFELERKRKK
jgi:lysophospholipid acyltransferase (LPLAT)-like uncharacterized protein